MTRQLKSQVVDEVASPNNLVRLPVYFDRNEKDFYVEITGPNDRVRANNVQEVKRLAREMLARAVEYKWEGIITVATKPSYDEQHKTGTIYYRGRDKHGAAVEVEFDRLERSAHPTRPREYVYRTHTIDFEAREPNPIDEKRRVDNADLKQWGVNPSATVVLYDDAVWAGLLAVKRSVDAAQAQLEALVGRGDLDEKLRLAGRQVPVPMLPEAVVEALDTKKAGRR